MKNNFGSIQLAKKFAGEIMIKTTNSYIVGGIDI